MAKNSVIGKLVCRIGGLGRGVGHGLCGIGRGVVDFVWPRRCVVCGCLLAGPEDCLCTNCLMELPRTFVHRSAYPMDHGYHLTLNMPFRMAVWYEYGDNYPRLARRLKFGGNPDYARRIARLFAREIVADGACGGVPAYFEGADMIIPVPIHFTRRLMRGYNQTEYIAAGISDVTGIPVVKAVRTSHAHRSQRFLLPEERAANVGANLFTVPDPRSLDGRHIIVVDDVITTGATLRAVFDAILAVSAPASLSALTIALSHK